MIATNTTILIADDDPQLLRLLMRHFQLEDFDVLSASDGEEALALIQTQRLDLVVLDVMMPKLDGLSVCQRVRTFSAIPILLLTARGQDQDKVLGLDLGADDYLSKPFQIDELMARVQALLRRGQITPRAYLDGFHSTITISELTVDYLNHQVTRSGQPVLLTPIEFSLLAYLAQNVDRVVPQGQLLEEVWGVAYLGQRHLLQVNIHRLRNKLEVDSAHPHYILTKGRVGYSLATPHRV
jgi:DNA-binding response OmpR family regulator